MSNRKRPDEIVGEIAVHRRQLVLAKSTLADLQSELDEQLVRGTAADTLATKVALEERRISALTRKIEDLEWKDLPAANLVRSEAEHQAALRSASALHEQWLAEAKELADLGAQLSRRWLSFHQREQLYADACYRAGYEAKPLNRAAVIALVSALVPPLIDELSRTYEIGVASGDGPVATVQNRAMSRLRRQSN